MKFLHLELKLWTLQLMWYTSEPFEYQTTQLLRFKGTESPFVLEDVLTCVGMPVCVVDVDRLASTSSRDMLWCCAIVSHFVKYSFW